MLEMARQAAKKKRGVLVFRESRDVLGVTIEGDRGGNGEKRAEILMGFEETAGG